MKELIEIWEAFLKSKKVSSMYLYKKTGFNSRGQSFNHLVSWWQRNILANEGPRELPIAALLVCLNNYLSLKTKSTSLTANCKNFLNFSIDREKKEPLLA